MYNIKNVCDFFMKSTIAQTNNRYITIPITMETSNYLINMQISTTSSWYFCILSKHIRIHMKVFCLILRHGSRSFLGGTAPAEAAMRYTVLFRKLPPLHSQTNVRIYHNKI